MKKRRVYQPGFYLRIFFRDAIGILRGHSGRMFFGQYCQQRGVVCRAASVARQLPKAIVSAARSEIGNWRTVFPPICPRDGFTCTQGCSYPCATPDYG